MPQQTEKSLLTPANNQNNTNHRDYILGIFYAISTAFLYSASCLLLKNIRNKEGQHMRFEENLIAKATVFLPASLLFMLIQQISLFGLHNKDYLILNLVGSFGSLYIHAYNIALYSMSVGDIHTMSFLSIISIMVLERIFRGKPVTLWRVIFSVGVIVGGALVARPTLDSQIILKQGHNSTLHGEDNQHNSTLHIEDDHPVSSFLSSRLFGLLLVIVGVNSEAILTILLSMINHTPPVLTIFHIAIWKIIFFPVSQLLLPSLGRLFSSDIVHFIQEDLVYHIATSLCQLAAWVFYILSLKKISPVLFTVIHCISLLFDYGGQAIIDGTNPNSTACLGIIITCGSVILFVLEKVIFKTEEHVNVSSE